MDDALQRLVPSHPDRHLQCVQGQLGAERVGDPPAHDRAAEGVDDERHDQNGVNTALKILGGWRLHYGRPIPEPGTPGPAFYYSRAGGATYHVLDSRYSLHPTRGGAWQPVLAALAVAQ